MAIADFAAGVQGVRAEMLKRAMQEAEMQEKIRQFNEGLAFDQSKLTEDARQHDTGLEQDQSQFTADLGHRRNVLGNQQREFDAEAPNREANAVYLRTQSAHLQGADARAEAERGHDRSMAGLEHGYRLGEIGAQGRNQQAAINARGAGGQNDAAGAYTAERTQRTRDSVKGLQNRVNRWTSGAGSLLSYLPETDARDFRADLDTLKANIAFNELTEMRQASKTGGALGPVSDKELGLLQSALGALDQGQSPGNLSKNLQIIDESLARWELAKTHNAGTPAGAADVNFDNLRAAGGSSKPIRQRNARTGQVRISTDGGKTWQIQ